MTEHCFKCGKTECELIATEENKNRVGKWACPDCWWKITVTRNKKGTGKKD